MEMKKLNALKMKMVTDCKKKSINKTCMSNSYMSTNLNQILLGRAHKYKKLKREIFLVTSFKYILFDSFLSK